MKSLIIPVSLILVLAACDSSDRVVHGYSNEPDNPAAGTPVTDTTEESANAEPTDAGNPGAPETPETPEAENTDNQGEGDAVNNTPPPEPATGLSAQHRDGQTFLTWTEVDADTEYHIYRADQPITTDNLAAAQLLTSKWGPIDADSSLHKHGTVDVPDYFVIEDGGIPLTDVTGLFVYTTQAGESGDAYYAVTSVGSGGENTLLTAGSNTLSVAIEETVATPVPVMITSYNDGKSRTYTQYMDYANWNPTLNGYAFNYFVTLPHNYDAANSYPLQVNLHEFGGKAFPIEASEHNWETIQIFPSDPGLDENTIHTWWYGHAADHNYQTDGLIPASGSIQNYTEQRVMQAVSEVIANPDFNVDTNLIHAVGNSMGASGALSLGLRYPSVFTGIYASQPMTNYSSSPLFQEGFLQLWGETENNLPNIIRGPYTEQINKYSAGASDAVAIWDWMNHLEQLTQRSEDDFAYLMIDVGKADTTIDYPTQGAPLVAALTAGKIPFTAYLADEVGHSWRNYNAVNVNQFGLSTGSTTPWHYPNSTSLIAVQNATGSGSLVPANAGDDQYNLDIEWATAENDFDTPIVDTANRFEVSLRSTSSAQSASVTPRNTQQFKPAIASVCDWQVTLNSDNSILINGQATVGQDSLLTFPNVPLPVDTGSRLVVTCP